ALARDRMGDSGIRMRHFLEVRYTGQDFSLPIPVDPPSYADDYRAAVRDAFQQVHESRFGYHEADLALEVVNAHLTATVPSRIRAMPAPPRRERMAFRGRRPVTFEADPIDCSIYRRESLAAGERIEGPAIIQEYASTTVLFPQDRAEIAR